MPAERAGYTVTMFLVDISPSMGDVRVVDLPPGPNGEAQTAEITNLEWALRYVKTKIQEMIFNNRKTDQCGVILFGSNTTKNIINEKNDGYDHVQEYITIAQANGGTLAKLDALEPSSVSGDPIDALIVAIETQAQYLGKKKTWTRKIVLVTDGRSEIETEDWEATVDKLNSLDIHFTIVGIDFDDPDWGYEEPNKSSLKRANETFFRNVIKRVRDDNGVFGTCAHALEEIARPEQRIVKSTLSATILRVGDSDRDPSVAIEIMVKVSKATALQRPASIKKFAARIDEDDEDDIKVDDIDPDKDVIFSQLKMRTEYFVNRKAGAEDEDEDIKMEEEEEAPQLNGEEPKKGKDETLERVDREELIRGFKYGTTYTPCPDDQFPRLETAKGIVICGFFPKKNFRRELSMGEVQYIWGDNSSPQQQVALSSLVKAMDEDEKMAIARLVIKDGSDPKMGVLYPCVFEKVDCLLWVQMPFADDVRKYAFASLDHLVSKKGGLITEHPYIPTADQLGAMDDFVDAMDLMDAGEKDEQGVRQQWFSTAYAYNPSIHRIKQALFHCAVVSDISTNPLPPPHPELLMYFEPPKRALKRAQEPLDTCKKVFNVKQVPKRIPRPKKVEHNFAPDETEAELLLNQKGPGPLRGEPTLSSALATGVASQSHAKLEIIRNDSGSETEDDEDEEGFLLDKPGPAPSSKGKDSAPFPTPVRSVSPKDDGSTDPGRAPGRIIGTTHPLKDFKKNLSQGDIVTKAVEDLGVVITEIVMKPFASRRNIELTDCMKAMRKTCLEEDEIDAWNAFLQQLKKKCLASKPGNTSFWRQVQNSGHALSLISDKEAERRGGESEYTEKQVQDFISL